MKVLVTTTTFPKSKTDSQPRFVQYLCLQLSKSIEIDILAPNSPDVCGSKKETDSYKIIHFRYFFRRLEKLTYGGGILENLKCCPFLYLLVPFFLAGQLIAVLKLIKRNRYDAIHAHWIIPQGLIAVLAQWISRKPISILVTSHGGDLFALKGSILKKLKKWILDRADFTTVVSHAMREYCISVLNQPANKVSVAPMGVDLLTAFIPPIPSQTERNDLIFVGRLVEKKGVQFMIRALDIIAKKYPQIRLNIVGDGPLKPILQKEVEYLGLIPNTVFHGGLPNDHIPPMLQKAAISVMPSIVASNGDQEGLGLSAVEAMGCGCPIVASDLPAIRDLIEHNKTGLLAEPGNSVDLAEKILMILENKEMAIKLSGAGRNHVLQRFDWNVVGRSYLGHIRSLVSIGKSIR